MIWSKTLLYQGILLELCLVLFSTCRLAFWWASLAQCAWANLSVFQMHTWLNYGYLANQLYLHVMWKFLLQWSYTKLTHIDNIDNNSMWYKEKEVVVYVGARSQPCCSFCFVSQTQRTFFQLRKHAYWSNNWNEK